MTRHASKQPTELELEILKILWKHGPATVREVREHLEPFRKLAHTSVMTVLGIMTEKEQVTREKQGNGYLYRARIRRDSTLKRMMGDLVQRAFDGSTGAAAIHLLEAGELNTDEVEALQTLIQKLSENK